MRCEDQFGITFTLQHKASCEAEAWIQEWIRSHFAPDVIFPNVIQLGGAMTEDITGVCREIPAVLLAIFSIECDTISNLNKNSAGAASCIEDNAGKTGRTANAIVDYAAFHKTKWLVVECTPKLLAQLKVLVTRLNKVGYIVAHQNLQAFNYGALERRERFYGVLVYMGAPLDQLHEKFTTPMWLSHLHDLLRTMQIGPLPLDVYLMADDDAEQRWFDFANAKDRHSKKKDTSS